MMHRRPEPGPRPTTPPPKPPAPARGNPFPKGTLAHSMRELDHALADVFAHGLEALGAFRFGRR